MLYDIFPDGDWRKHKDLISQILDDSTIQPIVVEIKHAFIFISALESFGNGAKIHRPLRELILGIATSIRAAIAERHPMAKTLQFQPGLSEMMLGRMMQDENPITFNVTYGELWIVVCVFQETVHHPDIPPRLQNTLTDFGHQFERPLIEKYGIEAKRLLDAEWE